ncbi:MAG TPA: SPFH domain-containing protein [Pirellulales bacterium]|jgi:regulator of protease activity HflC (stomatin/prohibitin superfamily)|nr:SPFH domain-containing protein [Pirellulales bacterium]
MTNYISSLVFAILILIGTAFALLIALANPIAAIAVAVAWSMVSLAVSASIKLAAQWEQGLVFRLGKYHSTRGPGPFFVIPLVDQVRMVDIRIRVTDIPAQQVITKDNVPVTINGVFFFKVANVADAVIKVQDYRHAIAQYAQTSLRDVIGQMTLDQLLVEREAIGKEIGKNVEKDIVGWGLEVTGIRIQDIDMPEELKKMMSRQASAEREKRATITKAEGDREASANLAAAAKTMAASPGAMQLRTLQTIDGLGPTASNTVLLALPIDVMDALNSVGRRGHQVNGRPKTQPVDTGHDRLLGTVAALSDTP